MKKLNALIYVNKEKDKERVCEKMLTNALKKYGVDYFVMDKEIYDGKDKFDVLFAIGGDGTILRRTEYANKNGVSIIGINAGKLGFLAEFEQGEIEEAVRLFVSGELVKDSRSTLVIEYNEKKYYGLNDIVLQRIYTDDTSGMIITNSIKIDDTFLCNITGDGVIVCTPTGSTAYSLSVGGAILAPGINAFSITPVAAHSFAQRPVIFSADSECKITYEKGAAAGIFVDGKMVAELDKGDSVTIKKAKNPTVFLRRKDYAFYAKLSYKLRDRL